MNKKFILSFLTIFFILNLFAFPSFTANDTTGICGANLIWDLFSDGTLTVSGTGDMYNYDYEKSPWYNDSRVKKVVIETGVDTIGKDAFFNCKNLTLVTMGESVKILGSGAFSYCENLTDIKVDINNNNFSDIDGVLFSKDKKTLIKYPQGKKANSYVVPNQVTKIDYYAFEDCKNLNSVIMPDSVTEVKKGAFAWCYGLSKIELSNNLITIERDAFSRCDSLSEIIIKNKVNKIGEEAFSCCFNLNYAKIFKGVVSIGSNSFYNCSDLTMYVEENSHACDYAVRNNISYQIINENLTVLDNVIKVENVSSNSTLVVGVYSNGILKNCKIKNIDTDCEIPFDSLGITVNKGDTVKAFLLENLQNIKPLCIQQESIIK